MKDDINQDDMVQENWEVEPEDSLSSPKKRLDEKVAVRALIIFAVVLFVGGLFCAAVFSGEPKGAAAIREVVYKDVKGEWRWRIRAGNNRIIADSGEGYKNREDCLHGLELLKDWAYAQRKEVQPKPKLKPCR